MIVITQGGNEGEAREYVPQPVSSRTERVMERVERVLQRLETRESDRSLDL